MKDEEIKQKFKETYPEYMYGDTPLSPYYDIWCYAIEIMEQENNHLAQHIVELQKDKGNLIDENKELKELILNSKKDGISPINTLIIKNLAQQVEDYKNGNFVQTVNQIIEGKDKRLEQAKEHIQTLISCLIDWVQEGDKDYCYIADAEQFLNDKCPFTKEECCVYGTVQQCKKCDKE